MRFDLGFQRPELSFLFHDFALVYRFYQFVNAAGHMVKTYRHLGKFIVGNDRYRNIEGSLSYLFHRFDKYFHSLPITHL